MTLLVAVASLVLSMRKVYIVTDTPEYPGFMNTYGVVQGAVPQLDRSLYDVTVLQPECVQCSNVTNMTAAEGLERLLGSMWEGTAMQDTIKSHLDSQNSSSYPDGTVVVSIATSLPAALSGSYASVSFVELQCKLGTSKRIVRNPNHSVLDIGTETGAYMNGVTAALASANGVKRVGVLYSDGEDRGAETAFWQGVSDADPNVCLISRPITMAVTNRTWNAAQYNAVKSEAADFLHEQGIDVLLSNLDVYDTAVLDAVAERAEANYVVFGVTAATTGGSMNLTSLVSTILTKVEVDWFAVLSYVLSKSKPEGITVMPVRTQSTWTFKSLIPPGPKVLEEQLTNCSAALNTTYADTVNNVYANVTQVSLSFPNDKPTGECTRLRMYMQPTRDVAQACLQHGDNVRLVGVGMYINNLGNVDMKAGSFYVDFNLYLHKSRTSYASLEHIEGVLQASDVCAKGEMCACPDFGQNEWENYIPANDTELFNSMVNLVNVDRIRTVTPVLKIDTVGTTDVLVDYFRVQGMQYFQPHLQNWPMDSQNLKIMLEDMTESTSDAMTLKFCHMDNFAGLSTSARYFPGMELEVGAGSPWLVDVGSACWPYLKYPEDYVNGVCEGGINPKPVRYDKTVLPDGDDSCTCLGGTKASSRYTMEISFTRPVLPSFMKTFLPAIFITLVNQGVWFLYPKVFETRLGVCGSSLISGVMYHVSVTSNTPETSVLTWADRFMVVVYFNNLVAFTAVFYQTILHQANMERLAWRSFRMTRMWGPMVAMSSFLGVAVYDSAFQVMIWILVSTAVCALFVYIVGDFLLHFFSRRWLAFLEQRNINSHRASHLSIPDDDQGIPLAECVH